MTCLRNGLSERPENLTWNLAVDIQVVRNRIFDSWRMRVNPSARLRSCYEGVASQSYGPCIWIPDISKVQLEHMLQIAGRQSTKSKLVRITQNCLSERTPHFDLESCLSNISGLMQMMR